MNSNERAQLTLQERIACALERLVDLAEQANPGLEQMEVDIVIDDDGHVMCVTGTHEGQVVDLTVLASSAEDACLAARDHWREHGLAPSGITASWDDQ